MPLNVTALFQYEIILIAYLTTLKPYIIFKVPFYDYLYA